MLPPAVSGGRFFCSEPLPTAGDYWPDVAKEKVMKQLAIAVGLLAIGFVGSTPARADYAVIQFSDRHCRIWWDSLDNPWGASWNKIAIGFPDRSLAQTAPDSAYSQEVCR